MGYKVKSYVGISKKAKPRFDALGGEAWLMNCYLRYKEGETLQSIAKDFDIPHTYVFDRFLDFRLDTKRLSRNIPESLFPEIISLWDEGYNSTEIANKLEIDYKSVLALLHNKLGKDTSLGIKMKAVLGLNNTAFSVPSEQRSYFYGLLLTDGCLWDNGTVEIRLKQTDRHILEDLKEFLCLKNEIKDYSKFDSRTGKTYSSSRVHFKSDEISSDLRSLGLTPRKSMRELCPEEFLADRHFWRGVIDGDGHVGHPKGLPSVGLCGSQMLCEQFLSFCEGLVEFKKPPKISKNDNNNLCHTSIHGIKALTILSVLYDNSEVKLKRKYERYKEHETKSLF